MNGFVDPPVYGAGSGSTGTINCVFKAGSTTPATDWYLNGGRVGTVPGTKTLVALAGHQVTFISGGVTFPSPPLAIQLDSTHKAVTITIHFA